MPRILFINAAVYLPGEHALKRTFYLFDMMLSQGYDVHFLTADFNHYNKSKRDTDKFFRNYPQYRERISFISVPQYKKNLSFGRMWSNFCFERKAKRWLKSNTGRFEKVYISLPTLYLAGSIRKICSKNNIQIIVDVNDLWPEAFRLIFKNELLYWLCTYPIKALADKGYRSADCIIAVSEEYKNRALLRNVRSKMSATVYLGAMLERFDAGVAKYSAKIEKSDDEFWIGYAGTIGTSYDLKTLIDAVKQLNDRGFTDIGLKVLGQGPEEKELKEYINKNNIANVDFRGFLEYEKMAAVLSKCDIMANCIKKRASQSIINKVSDYFAAGKPVINSCVSREMQCMIAENNVGINYEAESVESAVDAVIQLYHNERLRDEMGKNARHLAEEKFDRKRTHGELVDLLIKL